MSAEYVTESIPAGYKQTEVGVIPEDWEIKRLFSVCSMKSGEGITSADIDEYSPFPCYGGNGLRGYTKRYTHDGSYALIGRQGALCGNVLGLAGQFFASEHAVVVTPFPQTDICWLKFVLRNMNLNQYSESSAQPGLSVSKLSDLPLAFPPTLAEQEAISTTLSDTDALIESMEQLIAKKRQIKQGAMQELLTGKRRLPDFKIKQGYKHTELGLIPEDWSLKPLGELVTFLDGKRRPVKDVDRAKMRGTIPYYGASGIVDYVNDYLFDEDLILLGEDGENILSRNCRLAFRISGKAWVNNHAHVLRPNTDISIGFLTDYLESLNYEQFNSGTAQPKLNKQTCFRILIALPPTKKEQEAIATILSDMDTEVSALEQKLAKVRQIKQGMMQELLTGRIRLI